MRHVVLIYLKSVGLVVAVFALAGLVAQFAATKWPKLCRGWFRVVAFLLGSGLLLAAGIGRLGWSIQTWSGDSQAERLDQFIFLFLSLLGTFLMTFEYLAGHFVGNVGGPDASKGRSCDEHE
jgi:hypothetical protein